MTHSLLGREVAARIVAELASDGWRLVKGTRSILARPATKDVVARVGLAVSVRRFDQTVSVAPFVGVRHEAVAQLIERFYGDAAAAVPAAPTVVRGLADMVDPLTQRLWTFRDRAGLPAASAAVVEAVRSSGYPYMDSLVTFESVLRELRSGPRTPEAADSLAVVYGLLGEPESAYAAIGGRLREMDDPAAPELAAQSRTFIAAFTSYFDFDMPLR